MSAEVVCGKCGKKIADMKMLKSVKDVLRPYNNKCPECGQIRCPRKLIEVTHYHSVTNLNYP